MNFKKIAHTYSTHLKEKYPNRFLKKKGKQILFAAFIYSLFIVVYFQWENVSRYLWAHGYHQVVYMVGTLDAPLAMQMGNYYFGSGVYDLEKATRSYEHALQQDPAINLAYYQLARIYFVKGDFVTATEYIEKEIALHPLNLRSLYVRGLVEISQNNLPAAEKDFVKFIVWAPTEWGGYNDLAFVLAKQGKYAESERVVLEAFTKVPKGETVPWLWNSLGLAQLNQYKYTEAAQSFKKAVTLAQKVTPKGWQRAYSANDPESIEGSIATFQQSIEKNLQIAQAGAIMGE